ncbi:MULTISPECIES: hypothetical protein [unclassified Cupriavidus]|uniref:hypothetical protein n=1 Tax=Cupriavidus TaxID=106589 RepID=UPI00226ECE06|nr:MULTISPECIES: hypothetical protein [unclassified Cupriavidus]MCY0854383.1 hypothetical protein [Cupriavidus sp. D39]MDW3683311.1 hypothetical protein [Cupriavidus sp. CV2]
MLINLLGFLLFEALWFFPFKRVFRAAHFHPAYAIIALIPIAGPLACIWLLAMRPWPLKDRLIRLP